MIERLRAAGVVMSAPKRVTRADGALDRQDLRLNRHAAEPDARSGGRADRCRRRQSHRLGEQEDRLRRGRQRTREASSSKAEQLGIAILDEAGLQQHFVVMTITAVRVVPARRLDADRRVSRAGESRRRMSARKRRERWTHLALFVYRPRLSRGRRVRSRRRRFTRACAPSSASIASRAHGGALGGALLAFSYDAARPDARLPARTPVGARDAGRVRRHSGNLADLRPLHRSADDLDERRRYDVARTANRRLRRAAARGKAVVSRRRCARPGRSRHRSTASATSNWSPR